MEITERLASDAPNETELATLTDEFVKGDDKMKLHRQMYSATLLLQKNVILPKVLELVKAAVGNADAGLEVSTPAAAVMASELYESRTIAFSRNEIIVVPEVPRQTLSAILRGRIEELTGWTLYQQKSYPEAVVRLRRAISVLPEKSAWWRSSMWRLGSALEAEGKDKEALDSYVASYKTDRPNVYKYAVVEAAYKKVHGNTDGLEALIGPNPLPAAVAASPSATQEPKAVYKVPVAAPAPSGVPAETPAGSTDIGPITQTVNTPVKSPDKSAIQNEVIPAETKSREKTAVPESIKEGAESTTGVEPKPEAKSDGPNGRKSDEGRVTEKNAAPATNPDETALKGESTGPKKENVQVLEKASELKPISAEGVEKPSQTQKQIDSPESSHQGQVKDSEPSKQDDSKTAGTPAEGKPKQEGAKVLTETGETKAPILPAEIPPDVTAKEKAVKTPEAGPESTKLKTEVPEKTENPSAEPTNLLRDPFAIPEIEKKNEPKDAKPESAVDGAKTEKAAGNDGQLKLPVVTVSDPIGKEKTASAAKDLFEPVVIKIPSAKPPIVPKPETEKNTENVADASNGETAAKPTGGEPSSGATRARVVDGKEIKADAKCSLELSHETVSLLNAGGSLGILATVAGEGGFDEMTVISSSPNDVAVRAEPEIEGVTGRRFYVIKSVSTKTGLFQVVFESKCGKKEIVVRVR